MHCAVGGVCPRDVCLGVFAWGVCPGGSAQGGLPRECMPGGVCPGGCLPKGVAAQGVLQTPPQRGVKTLPCRSFVAGGNKKDLNQLQMRQASFLKTLPNNSIINLFFSNPKLCVIVNINTEVNSGSGVGGQWAVP